MLSGGGTERWQPVSPVHPEWHLLGWGRPPGGVGAHSWAGWGLLHSHHPLAWEGAMCLLCNPRRATLGRSLVNGVAEGRVGQMGGAQERCQSAGTEEGLQLGLW